MIWPQLWTKHIVDLTDFSFDSALIDWLIDWLIDFAPYVLVLYIIWYQKWVNSLNQA